MTETSLFHAQKHLMHLKVIQQMARVPRSVGIPPLSDDALEAAFTSHAAAATAAAAAAAAGTGGQLVPQNGVMMQGALMGTSEDDGRINPLAGMGLTDEQYTVILQNLVNGESFAGVARMSLGGGASVTVANVGEKRSLDDASDMREGKRSRFELVE